MEKSEYKRKQGQINISTGEMLSGARMAKDPESKAHQWVKGKIKKLASSVGRAVGKGIRRIRNV